ncbi:hypothetical protein [Pseudovibrio sp. SCP19]|uniref:hypothetical protein n=1 Tax=Pseudovibrio sp. SCP19 TaxID=3141374 RepID=UPI003338E08A
MNVVYETLHIFTSGKPKGVSHVVSSSMAQESFRCIALSSSPSPILWKLAEHVSIQDSDRVRLLEIAIPETQYGIWDPSFAISDEEPPQTREDTENLLQNASLFYGTAGRAWIKHLTRNQDNLSSLIPADISKFVKARNTNKARKNRIAKKVALIRTAGKLAVEAGLIPCSTRDITAACKWAYREIVKNAFGHELKPFKILRHIEKQLKAGIFGSFKQAEISGNAKLKRLDGFVNQGNAKLIVTKSGFEKIFENLLPQSNAARNRALDQIRTNLIEVGALLTDKNGKHIKSVNIAWGGQRRLIIDLKHVKKHRKKLKQSSAAKSSNTKERRHRKKTKQAIKAPA